MIELQTKQGYSGRMLHFILPGDILDFSSLAADFRPTRLRP